MRIEYVRDGLVEEFHDGIVLHYKEGNSRSEPYYLRSCAKPLQASLLMDYGADLTEDEIALCCGSHSGEECHVEIARRILKNMILMQNFLSAAGMLRFPEACRIKCCLGVKSFQKFIIIVRANILVFLLFANLKAGIWKHIMSRNIRFKELLGKRLICCVRSKIGIRQQLMAAGCLF